MKVQINTEFQRLKETYKTGDVITISTDSSGVPTSKFWRNRLRDSEHDNCISVVSPASEKSKDKEKKGKDES